MKLGAQLYTVRDYTKTPEDIEATLRRVKAMGFDVIQISGFGPCGIDRLAGWVRELGLEVCVTHTPWARLADSEELKAVIGEHRKLGCPHIGLGARPGDVFQSSHEGYTRCIRKLNAICAQVEDAGLSFGYHNHDFEFEQWGGVRAIDRLIDECPRLKFILDTFWVQAGGCNPVSYIRKLAGRIEVIHFKDYRIRNHARQFAEIGRGNLEWKEIIDACKAAAIPCAVIEQDGDFLVDPFESLAESRAFLREQFASTFD